MLLFSLTPSLQFLHFTILIQIFNQFWVSWWNKHTTFDNLRWLSRRKGKVDVDVEMWCCLWRRDERARRRRRRKEKENAATPFLVHSSIQPKNVPTTKIRDLFTTVYCCYCSLDETMKIHPVECLRQNDTTTPFQFYRFIRLSRVILQKVGLRNGSFWDWTTGFVNTNAPVFSCQHNWILCVW